MFRRLAVLSTALFACIDIGGGVPGTTRDLGVDAGVDVPDFGVPPEEPDAPPVLTSLSPDEGPVEGGTRVLLRGEAFTGPAQVFFGDVEAPTVEVLDFFGIEAVTPENDLGTVDVRIVTPTGTSSISDAFTYLPVLEINEIVPARVPEEGGVPVEVIGRGFTEDTLILVGRRPLQDAVRISSERISGIVPPLPPGRPRVEGVVERVRTVRDDLLTVYATPDVSELEPASGPADGGIAVAIRGSGLADVEQVLMDGIEAPFDGATAVDGTRLSVIAPALAPGPVDLTLVTADGDYVFESVYAAVAAMAGLSVQAVVPDRAEPGSHVTVAGTGFAPGAEVRFDNVASPDVEVLADGLRVQIPNGLGPGPVDVEVRVGADAALLPDGLRVLEPLAVDSLTPGAGPARGATDLVIRGSGFTPDLVWTLQGLPLVDVQFISAAEVQARTLGGSAGLATLRARRRPTSDVEGSGASLPDAFAFEEATRVLRIHPVDGSIGGNTYVTVYGWGLTDPASVSFGGAAGTDVRAENGSVLAVRTPPISAGPVNVEVQTEGLQGDGLVLPGAYTYFDPRVPQGGGFGGRIDGDLNVSVVDNQFAPVPGVLVQLGLEPSPENLAVTDDLGIATLSRPDLRGPLTITAGAPGTEFNTFVDYDTRNLTVRSAPFPVIPEDPPINPCPADPVFPVVRGRVFGLKSELDPDTEPDRVPVVTVTYSAPSIFSQNPVMPDGQFDFVTEEGGEFEIITARGGSVAVYALLEEVDRNNPNDRRPVRLGIARSVPVAFGQPAPIGQEPEPIVTEVDIDMNIDLDQTFDIRLDDPPDQFPGPSLNVVFPFLNLESDGVIRFPVQIANSDVITLQNMPRLAQSEFIYLAGSFTQQGGGAVGPPFSLSVQTSVSTVEGDEADLGPYLRTPTNLTPKFREVLEDAFRWELAEGVTADMTVIHVNDVIGVPSTCCVDLNGNGVCDEGLELDPQNLQSGVGPVFFDRWSFYGPGELTEMPVPLLPQGVTPWNAPQILAVTLDQALAPRFTFDEFVWLQFNPALWDSWTTASAQISVKETTD